MYLVTPPMQTENERADIVLLNEWCMYVLKRVRFKFCSCSVLSGDSCVIKRLWFVCLQEVSDIILHSCQYVVMRWSPSSNIYLERCFSSAALLLLSTNAFNNRRGGCETKDMSPWEMTTCIWNSLRTLMWNRPFIGTLSSGLRQVSQKRFFKTA